VNLQERESSILGLAPRIFLSGFSEEEKGSRELQVCGEREYVDRQSLNNKRVKTF
jgi:hypothetical protein